MTHGAVLFPPKALTRSGTCKKPRELVLRLKIAQAPCPDATRLSDLFVYRDLQAQVVAVSVAHATIGFLNFSFHSVFN